MTTSIEVHRHNAGRAFPQIEGPFITWQQATVSLGSEGAEVWLCTGRHALATSLLVGGPYRITDTLEAEADLIGPWLPAMAELDIAVRSRVAAENLTLSLARWSGAVEYHRQVPWYERGEDDGPEASAWREQILSQLPAGALSATNDDVYDTALTHRSALESRGAQALVRAVRAVPAPGTPRPSIAWTPMYDSRALKEIRNGHDAELPRLLLDGWRRAMWSDDTKWPEAESIEIRDWLIRWAVKWRLPKNEIHRASGVARSTIDRILSE